MSKKSMIIILLILILVVGTVLFFIDNSQKISYSKNPQDWIEKKGDVQVVNVEKATEGKGYYNLNDQQYKSASVETAFSYDGVYNGKIFKNYYADDSGKALIQITQNLVPNDGILHGIIVEKFENKVPVAYIFLDEDWKKQFGNSVNIEWGQTYQNFKAFEFKTISSGIYMDKITDDKSRFNEDYSVSSGGIIVGNIKESGKGLYQLEEETAISLS